MRNRNRKYIQRRQHEKFVKRFEERPEVVSPKEIIANVAAMFCYHVKDVTEVLEYYSNDNVERIAEAFIDIIENHKFRFHKGKVKLSVNVDENIFAPVKALVTMKMSDIITGKMVRAMVNELFNYNKKGKYGLYSSSLSKGTAYAKDK